MKKHIISFCLMIALVTVPAFAKKPKWVDNPNKKYSAKKFLTGVGIGSSMDSARENARAEIAKIFEVHVAQMGKNVQKESSLTVDEKTDVMFAMNTMLATTTSTDAFLKGIEIRKTSFDKKKKEYYALAILNKKDTQKRLTEEIKNKETEIGQNLSKASKTKDAVKKIRNFIAALKTIDEKNILLAKRAIVAPKIKEDKPDYSKVEIKQKRDKEIDKIVFILDVEDSVLKTALGESITKLGFSMRDIADKKKKKDEVSFVLVSSMTVSSADRTDPNWKFYRWQGSLTLTTGKTVIVSVDEKGQSSHITEENARMKARNAGIRVLSQALEKRLKEFVFGIGK